MRRILPAIAFLGAVVGTFSGSSWGADDGAQRVRPHSSHLTVERTPIRSTFDMPRGESSHRGVVRDNARTGELTSAAVLGADVPLQKLGELVTRYGNKERTGTATGGQYLHDLATTVKRYRGTSAPPTSVSAEQVYQNIRTVGGLVQPYVAKNGWGDIGTDVAQAPTKVGEVSSVAVLAGESVPLQNLGELVSRYGNKERTGTATGAEYLRDLGTTVNRYRGTDAAPTSISVEQFIQNVTTLQGLAQPYVESNGWGDIDAVEARPSGYNAHPHNGAIQTVKPEHPSLKR